MIRVSSFKIVSATVVTGFLLMMGRASLSQASGASPTIGTHAPPTVTPQEREANRQLEEQLLHNDWGSLSRYRAADAALPPPAKSEKRVIFMGDSITEAWGAKNNKLFPITIDFFPGRPYINRGISGQTSPQMLVRFRQDVIALKPAVVVIMSGTNDIAGNTGKMELSDTEANLHSMSDLARANGIRVVLCSVLPAADFWWRPGLHPSETIRELNTWIKQYAADRHFPYVDYHSALADSGGGFRSGMSPDGVHPNDRGYAVMAPLAEAGIAEALQSER